MLTELSDEENFRLFEDLNDLEDSQFEFEDEENTFYRFHHKDLENNATVPSQGAAAHENQSLQYSDKKQYSDKPLLASQGRLNMSHSDHMGHDMHQAHNMGDHSGHAEHSGHMEHSGHGPLSGHNTMTHNMMMDMTFHGGVSETILFEQWHINSVGGLIGSFIAIFVMALLYEGLKYYRKHLLWKTYAALQYCAVNRPDKTVGTDDTQIRPIGHMVERKTPTMLSRPHAWQTVLHGLQVLVSYMLMLVFMTYNLWLCAAVVLGSAVGYFLFGWRESVVVDFTEHCH